jgi:ribose transport system substrate-binding protein
MSRSVVRRGPALLLSLLAVVFTALLAVGCGGGGGGETSGGGGGEANVSHAEQLVGEHTPIQEFKPPGPAFDASKAKGKKVLILPVSSNVPFNVLTGKAMEQAVAPLGVKVQTYSNQGQPSQWQQGMRTAISNKVDAIAAIGLDPAAIAPQIAEAKQAGIPFIEDHFLDAQHPNPQGYENVDARIPAPYIEAGKLSAAWAIQETKGDVNAILVTSKDILSAGDVLRGIEEEFKADCPGCERTTVDVPFNDWASKMQTAVQSALTQNPNANYIIPVFDGMVQFAAPAVTAAGASSRVKIASYNATPSVLGMMQEGEVVSMDSGESYDWLGWGLADQVLRVLTGTKPTTSENIPLRIFEKENVNEAGEPPEVNKGYGNAYISGYEELWGLK